jgi:hypothetical protein
MRHLRFAFWINKATNTYSEYGCSNAPQYAVILKLSILLFPVSTVQIILFLNRHFFRNLLSNKVKNLGPKIYIFYLLERLQRGRFIMPAS